MMSSDGGPAFPCNAPTYKGMTLRDYFAAAIASGVVSRRSTDDRYGVPPRELAKLAYECADALLDERAKV